jgi:hypothetical protein
MRVLGFVFHLAVALLLAGPADAAEDAVLSVGPRPGVTVKYRYIAPDRPKAAAVLLEGGSGLVRFNKPDQFGFLVANARTFAAQGIAVALVNAPSDQRGFENGMPFTFRATAEHRTDIAAVLAALEKKLPGVPHWVIGISAGSISAAAYAGNSPDGLDGVVMLSSIARPPKKRTNAKISVFSFPIHRIAVPLLALAHADDTCRSTPPDGAKRIVNLATASRHAEVMFVRGGDSPGQNPCRPRTHHTFFGIEDEVVAKVAKFIFGNSPR